MTIEAGERESGHIAGHGDVAGSVVTALVALTRDRSGESGVAQVLALADERRAFARLADPHRWSSLDQAAALFNAASLVTGDPAVALHVGGRLIEAADDPALIDWLVALGRPAAVFGEVSALLSHFDETATAAAIEADDDHALVRVTPRPGTTRHAHLCEMTRGLLVSLPIFFGDAAAFLSESECAARGGRYCLYAASWDTQEGIPQTETAPPLSASEPPSAGNGIASESVPDAADPSIPPPDHGARDAGTVDSEVDSEEDGEVDSEEDGEVDGEVDSEVDTEDDGGALRRAAEEVSRLDAELRQMGAIFEDAVATSLELLDDDVDTLLGQIAARADSVVNADSYLLMIRVDPGRPVHLHSRGIEPDEEEALAAELWGQDPGAHDSSRLVVDITSRRRRYGRMAVFFPANTPPDPTEVRMIDLYASYAAAALDIRAVLADAERSNVTTQALLNLSEQLSRVTSLSDAVQLVVDTVPEVTGCDRATIFLWNDRDGHLVPRARTTGRELGGAYSGIFAVTGLPIRPAAPRAPRQASRRGNTDASGTSAVSDEPTEDPTSSDAAVADEVVSIPTNVPLMERLVNRREVIVVTAEVDDPALRRLLTENGSEAAVIAPLFTAGELLGTLSASFRLGTPASAYQDPDVHERLARFAGQAATTLQNLDLLEKISHLAWHDALTGLPNRRLFEDRVEQELVRSRRVGEPVCMFFVDLDHFKTVNDTYGHAVGDELVQVVSDRLIDTVRSQDTVARVGGDEFAILLPGLANQLDIDQLAERTLEAIAEPCVLSGLEVETTASIGVAVAPEHGDTYDALLSRADEAMYRAKSAGRNAFQMYSLAHEARSATEIDPRALYRNLVHALGSDQFFLVYQPYVDLRTTEVLGVEALLRWNHPEHGVLEPASFVPLAEHSDVIVQLDTWVVEQACRQLRVWVDAGLPAVRLAVNLASKDLEEPDYARTIARALSDNRIDPDRLELDITERVVVDDDGVVRNNVDRLRRLGVRFTVDDFGTANSSLTRIGAFPISTLKIDRSFVQVLSPGGDGDDLVSDIVQMAARLGLDCVAEGVETPQQSRVLLQRGCTAAQGFYLCPPLAPAELESALTVVSRDEEGNLPGDNDSPTLV
jgi:diguanylate cyclase (GGDEF)-like protein